MRQFNVIIGLFIMACSSLGQNSHDSTLQLNETEISMKPTPKKSDTVQELSMKQFSCLEDLRTWATTSTFGGGRLIVLQQKETIYFIVDRMFTSGMVSSETSVFVQEKNEYVRVYYLPLKYVSRHYEFVDGDLIITEQLNPHSQEKIIVKKQELQVHH